MPPPHRIYVSITGVITNILVYFAYNGIVFGGVMPVSGASKPAWSRARWENEGGYSLA